jgi:phospholipid transport system transporter-binding protein
MSPGATEACGLESGAPGSLRLRGELGFDNAGAILQQSLGAFAGQARVEVDLSGLAQVDSAGLALLLEWLRLARAEGRTVSFAMPSERLRALARLSGVEEMLFGSP